MLRLPHRIVITLIYSVCTFIVLALCLDRGLSQEPLLALGLPLVFNFICAMIVCLKFFTHLGMVNHSFLRVAPMTGFETAYALVALLSLTTSEILFCLHLFGHHISYTMILIPFWVFLAQTVAYLGFRTFESHRKAT